MVFSLSTVAASAFGPALRAWMLISPAPLSVFRILALCEPHYKNAITATTSSLHDTVAAPRRRRLSIRWPLPVNQRGPAATAALWGSCDAPIPPPPAVSRSYTDGQRRPPAVCNDTAGGGWQHRRVELGEMCRGVSGGGAARRAVAYSSSVAWLDRAKPSSKIIESAIWK